MKRLALAAVLSLALAPAAFAKEPTAQQQKMKQCNADATAKSLKGDERKKFMSGCLGSGGAPAEEKKLSPQQERMKKCNAEASEKKLKGQPRKDFMSTCLKG